ncbi:hypothetical protein PC116_g12488 [Phytophthora cactorum]|nr:hypothetical protein PC112_g9003 [Phytophthora cactorum]KAG4239521.1 hypothetical protein PC116_g12488 [Phytophthora cactorum]
MRVTSKGGGQKPKQRKLTSETFALKSAVLLLYDAQKMEVVIHTFWPGIDRRSTAYKSKARIIRRWKQQREHIDAMAAKARTAQQKRFRHIGTAKTLSDDAEMDILEWQLASLILAGYGVILLTRFACTEGVTLDTKFTVLTGSQKTGSLLEIKVT